MEHFGDKLHYGWLVWVIVGKGKCQVEGTIFKGRICRSRKEKGTFRISTKVNMKTVVSIVWCLPKNNGVPVHNVVLLGSGANSWRCIVLNSV